ncbi:penicillin-binding protein 1A [Zymomonas mobilis]|uniref:Penicillin-binding protein 1A n=1 Tax=Zymomonas mobilis subsp. pomaceae (strain ATCC 29192 / DSM 22645 / JCM 10191 / CCUG 17912 / NBRC 13757 / NCIMB 11200 / NRRL B-4491 / Barker I) TaxID=579138 RepID=F8ESW8_ZYMMT|nr:PBP1A family penicillin-binding protein [Zymomonas mobilis]AEI37872.1 penicillin-binding protein, 1A family [Zymomonas mobilis subsp. pomaceae ATCC 29192]MDX5949239.1 PBP1A family penicillin-binding protein [Zymomonas mobilis subsp. pomaceae]GEB89532.1 penicillin-binding protein [Zymomonas mobilis subsp. pomaceae]
MSKSLMPEEGLNIKSRRLGDASFKRGTRRKILKSLFVFFIMGCSLGSFLFWHYFLKDLPSVEVLADYHLPMPAVVRDINGMPFGRFMREHREKLGYEDFPPVVIQAFLAAEDKTFFSHHGIDAPAFLKAVYEYFTKMGTGERAHGGSTITQQVAKNILVGDEYSPTRKVKEGILAFRIEHLLTKRQILEIYLNQIFLGRNAYGVSAAAKAYFGKNLKDLTLPEAAFLAILPKAPANYIPERHAERALGRRAYVLQQMQANGYITAYQRDEANRTPLRVIEHHIEAKPPSKGGYFLEEIRRELISRFGETAEESDNNVYSGGLWIRSSFDPEIQESAETALRDGFVRFERDQGWSGRVGTIDPGEGWQERLILANVGTGYADWQAVAVLERENGRAKIGFNDGSEDYLYPWAATIPRHDTVIPAWRFLHAGDIIIVKKIDNFWVLRSLPKVSGGMVVENPHNGRILAMQGGFDSKNGDFNRATQAERQPGSTFKPFVYAAALDHGMTPASIIVDGPFCVYQSARLGMKCFRNFSGGYSGPQTMRWGVEQSRNLMTVRAAAQTGMVHVVKMAENAGINPPGHPYPPVLGIALGAGNTTVMRLTNGYSMIANQGRRLQPTLIDYVQDRNGKVIFKSDNRPCPNCNMSEWDGSPMPRPKALSEQAINPVTAYQMLHILEGVVQRGTAAILRDLGRPMFGKTGTSTGPTNVWFVGGSADMVAGLYVGYDRPHSMGHSAQGGTVAAPIFKQFAQKTMANMPVRPFPIAPNVHMVKIDRYSGLRIYGSPPFNPEDPMSPIIWEAFKADNEPKRSFYRSAVMAPAPSANNSSSAAPVTSLSTDHAVTPPENGILPSSPAVQKPNDSGSLQK